jgi:hypothetical protein
MHLHDNESDFGCDNRTHRFNIVFSSGYMIDGSSHVSYHSNFPLFHLRIGFLFTQSLVDFLLSLLTDLCKCLEN